VYEQVEQDRASTLFAHHAELAASRLATNPGLTAIGRPAPILFSAPS
jgi:hypothetical protein